MKITMEKLTFFPSKIVFWYFCPNVTKLHWIFQFSNLAFGNWSVQRLIIHYLYEDENVKVEAFSINHGGLENSFGFVFITEDKKIVFSGDTAYSEKLIEKAKNADILVHVVYCEEGFKEKTKDWPIYHKAHHTSSVDVGIIAKKSHFWNGEVWYD